MSKRVRRKIRKVRSKVSRGRKVILLFILVLAALTVLYPFSKLTLQNGTVIKNGESRIEGTLVYPGSSEQLYTQNQERITVNYKTTPGVEYQKVISFYLDSLPNLGWKLISSSDVDAVFEKGDKKIRIWILYTDNNLTDGVDYIIDYSPSQSEKTEQLN